MDPHPVEILFPMGGAHNATPRQAQPAGTVPPEALSNVMPWDRTPRQRGSTRPGTLDRLTIDAGPISAMAQVTTYKSPINSILIGDSFIPGGGGGYLVNQPLEHNPPGTWTVYQTNGGGTSALGSALAAAVPATSPSDTIIDATLGVKYDKRGAHDQDVGCIRNIPAQYADSYTIGVDTAGATLNNVYHYCVVRYDPTDPDNCVIISMFYNGLGGANPNVIVSFFDALGNELTSSPGSVVWNPPAQGYQVTVNGDVITCNPGGTGALVTCTTSVGRRHLGVGFAFNVANGVPTASVDNFFTTYVPPPSPRVVNLIAVSNQSVYIGSPSAMVQATGGSGVVALSGYPPQICYAAGQAYIVDGVNLLQVDVPNLKMATYAATAGTAPVHCKLACVWRGRLVLANNDTTPQNFYMSRVGVPTDWDFSQIDPAAAVAGNASAAGHIGEPILALAPVNDDNLLIFCDSSIYMLRGDPGSGGSIDLLSDAIGILGPTAWCKSPDGTVYFAATGGLYRMKGETFEEFMSSRFEFFSAKTRTQALVNLAWDRDRNGMWIMVCPILADTSLNRNLWYDARTDGFFPMGFPDDWGPVSVAIYDGDLPDDRQLLFGGRTGHLFQVSDTAFDDAGAAFNSSFWVGPIKLGAQFGYSGMVPGSDLNEGTVASADIILGEDVAGGTMNAVITLGSDHDAYKALNGQTYQRTKTFTRAGRQTRWMMRQRGVDLFFNCTSNAAGKHFSFERATMWVVPGGRERR